jgi:exodeoxyribonuclease-3
MYKFISWNVNGLRAVCGKGFADIFEELDADFFCLQETKLQAGQIDLEFLGYRSYWNYADKKGYSGTAIFTKHDPVSVSYGIGIDEHDHEGRVITLEMEDFYLVCVYTPNAQDGLKRLDYRMRWEDDFRAYLKGLAEKEHPRTDGTAGRECSHDIAGMGSGTFRKGVIVCGDLNVAHKEIDLKNPKGNRQNPGFTDEERGQFTNLLDAGFTDTFRYFYPDQTDIYSWWSYRFQARQKNVGWRIDYFVVSDDLRARLKDAKIHTEIFGSDHCPVELTIE